MAQGDSSTDILRTQRIFLRKPNALREQLLMVGDAEATRGGKPARFLRAQIPWNGKPSVNHIDWVK
jgi:hypothetical protein